MNLTKRVIKIVLLASVGSIAILEAYLQVVYRCNSTLPSQVRAFNFRYFDADGTPRFIPEVESWHRSYGDRVDILVKINKEGFRGAEPLESPSVRISLIGDSTVFNGGVTLEESFPYLMEQQLRDKLSDPGIEVLNFGVFDTGARNHYMKLRNQVRDYASDLVIVFIYLNDSITPVADGISTSERRVSMPWYHSFVFDHLNRFARHLWIFLKMKASGELEWIEDFKREEYIHDHGAWEKMIKKASSGWGAAWSRESWALIEYWISEILKLDDKPPLFVIMPASPQVKVKTLSEHVLFPQHRAQEMASRLGITILDPLPYFREQSDVNALFYDQCHFTVKGNEVMAEFLVPRVLEWIHVHREKNIKGWLPATNKVGEEETNAHVRQ